MEYVILIIIGLAMGLLGGLLGIGGSVVMIPALTLVFGEDQHLYQASAMICNFFVATSSLIAHRKAESFVWPVLQWLIPLGILGVLAGVAISNLPVFAGDRSYILARLFGIFLIYVVIYNVLQLRKKEHHEPHGELLTGLPGKAAAGGTGLVTGLGAGLLGMGAGTVSTPMQQILLKMPIRQSMSNSAALITSMAWIGAIYKNATLAQHGISWMTSLRMAAIICPSAILGGYIGGHLMHALPRRLVRIIFILVVIVASVRLISVKGG